MVLWQAFLSLNYFKLSGNRKLTGFDTVVKHKKRKYYATCAKIDNENIKNKKHR